MNVDSGWKKAALMPAQHPARAVGGSRLALLARASHARRPRASEEAAPPVVGEDLQFQVGLCLNYSGVK